MKHMTWTPLERCESLPKPVPGAMDGTDGTVQIWTVPSLVIFPKATLNWLDVGLVQALGDTKVGANFSVTSVIGRCFVSPSVIGRCFCCQLFCYQHWKLVEDVFVQFLGWLSLNNFVWFSLGLMFFTIVRLEQQEPKVTGGRRELHQINHQKFQIPKIKVTSTCKAGFSLT